MSRLDGKLPSVQTPVIDGVTITRHALELEAASLMALARRVRKRMVGWIRKLPTQRAAMMKLEGEWVPVLGADGQPVMTTVLPDEMWLENAKWYQQTVMGLLREQRERAKLAPKSGASQMDDATFDADLAELGRQAARELPAAELRKLLAEKEALDVEGSEVLVSTNNESRDDDEI